MLGQSSGSGAGRPTSPTSQSRLPSDESQQLQMMHVLLPISPSTNTTTTDNNTNTNTSPASMLSVPATIPEDVPGEHHIIMRTDLDPILLPYLAQSPHIDKQLERVVRECQRSYPQATRTTLSRLIREWYRKRREYMTHRIYNYCNKHYRLVDGGMVLERLSGDVGELDRVRAECKLDVVDVEAARAFAYDRVVSFFTRRKSRH